VDSEDVGWGDSEDGGDTTPMKTLRIAILGLGNVGRNLARILDTQRDLLAERHGLHIQIIGVADSRGAAIDVNGIDPRLIFEFKDARKPIDSLPGIGRPGMSALELSRTVACDVIMEATPVDLKTGEPGLSIVREALTRGVHCVLANKGPLALAYQELAALSDLSGDMQQAASRKPALRFSSGVGGALPTINIGLRDLSCARITRVEAMLNGTCQGILRLMESGQSFDAALAEMQRRGIVEADPSLDIDGWDAAVKLVIVANAVLRRPTTLADLSVTGIRTLTLDALRAASARGERIVLLGLAEARGGDWALSVAPVALPVAHPLARMGGDEMGVVYHTDISGTLTATAEEHDATPTAAAMLRDLIEVARLSSS
jgi:homoserine dehydrogenase